LPPHPVAVGHGLDQPPVGTGQEETATAEERFLRAEPSGAVVAGNRYGLPDVIRAAWAANLWRAFAEALKKAKVSA
jgi:hypothetical protein